MRRYKEFVERVEVKNLEDPGRELAGGFILGDSYFVQWVKETFLGKRAEERQIPQLRRLKLARLYFYPYDIGNSRDLQAIPSQAAWLRPKHLSFDGLLPKPFFALSKTFFDKSKACFRRFQNSPLGLKQLKSLIFRCAKIYKQKTF